jgi:hypothetical protein
MEILRAGIPLVDRRRADPQRRAEKTRLRLKRSEFDAWTMPFIGLANVKFAIECELLTTDPVVLT